MIPGGLKKMKPNIDEFKPNGVFYIKHFRGGKLIHEENNSNIFVNEGLVYGLNAAFGASIGGAPAALANMYIGMTTVDRVWQGTDKADDSASGGIHTVGLEFTDYTTGGDATLRPTWVPQALADINNIELSDSGAEATFNITADDTVIGAFLISTNLKNGTLDDATALLLAGSNFGSARILYIGDVFKVGYVLQGSTTP
jgi:hypothetical protein